MFKIKKLNLVIRGALEREYKSFGQISLPCQKLPILN